MQVYRECVEPDRGNSLAAVTLCHIHFKTKLVYFVDVLLSSKSRVFTTHRLHVLLVNISVLLLHHDFHVT